MNPNSQVDEELRDIQGYQSIIIPDFVWWVLIALAVMAIGYLIYKYIKTNKKQQDLSIFEKTIKDLDTLDTQKDSKTFYLEYSDIVRNYLLERINLNLFDKTLNELRVLFDKSDLLDLQSQNQLLNIFAKADMAKFAKKDISPQNRLDHIEKTKEILKLVENQVLIESGEKKNSLNLNEAELKEVEA